MSRRLKTLLFSAQSVYFSRNPGKLVRLKHKIIFSAFNDCCGLRSVLMPTRNLPIICIYYQNVCFVSFKKRNVSISLRCFNTDLGRVNRLWHRPRAAKNVKYGRKTCSPLFCLLISFKKFASLNRFVARKKSARTFSFSRNFSHAYRESPSSQSNKKTCKLAK